jgi:hypothetical protein
LLYKYGGHVKVHKIIHVRVIFLEELHGNIASRWLHDLHAPPACLISEPCLCIVVTSEILKDAFVNTLLWTRHIITVHCRAVIKASVTNESARGAGIKDRVKIIQFSTGFGTKS